MEVEIATSTVISNRQRLQSVTRIKSTQNTSYLNISKRYIDNRMEATESTRSAGPKLCKENRYYYRHREEILARQKLKKMEDPEFAARQVAREQLKAEREQKAAEKEAKKEEERIKREEDQRKLKDAKKEEKNRLKREMVEEKARAVEQKRLLKATLLGVV